MARLKRSKKKICEHCGRVFVATYLHKWNNIYCSRQCTSDSRIGETAINKGRYTKTSIVECLFCKKEFRNVLRSRTGTYTKYCSNRCFADARSKSRTVYINCATCKKDFRSTLVHIKLGKKYCSKKCFYTNPDWLEYHRLQMLGEGSPMWKGGITPIHRAARTTSAYRQWRKTVFERDNYTCQECGATKVYLNADHIKSFALYPELRCEVSNGRTLCVPCHKSKTKKEQKVLWKNQYSLV